VLVDQFGNAADDDSPAGDGFETQSRTYATA